MKSFKLSNKAKSVAKLSSLIMGITLLAMADVSFAKSLTVGSISGNVNSALSGVAKLMNAVGLVAGIGFILASFFKFHQHKLNPTQVPLSQGLTLLVIGAGLVLFPTLIPTATSVITGSASSGSVSKLSGSGMKSLVGS